MDLSVGEIILWAVIIWIVSQILLGIGDAFQIVKLQERVDFLKKLSDIIHQVKIERNGDIEYWYDQDSEQFLGQGKTVDEIAEVLKRRFPEHLFLVKDVGGMGAQTDWKLLGPEEFSKIKLNTK